MHKYEQNHPTINIIRHTLTHIDPTRSPPFVINKNTGKKLIMQNDMLRFQEILNSTRKLKQLKTNNTTTSRLFRKCLQLAPRRLWNAIIQASKLISLE